MEKRVYCKLIRDKIPEIMEANGQKFTTRILDQEDYLQALDNKLGEELAEYQKSKSLEELADLLEVMQAVVTARGYTWEELTDVQEAKRETRGAFDRRIFLEDVFTDWPESGRTPIEMLVRLSWLYNVPVDILVQRDRIALTIKEQTKKLQDFKAQFAEMNELMKDSTKVTPEIMAMWQAMGALVDSTLDYAQQQSDKQ